MAEVGVEIERKFLVRPEALVEPRAWHVGRALRLTQGYLSTRTEAVVRARLSEPDDGPASGFLTIKGKNLGATRSEFEYEVPAAEASEMLSTLCGGVIDKTRYVFETAGKTWEVDEFHGANDGLIVAEIELLDESETFGVPAWIGAEVTGDARYYNSNLSQFPFSSW